MSLISKREILVYLKLKYFGFIGSVMVAVLMKLLKISRINSLYQQYRHLDKNEFINEVLKELDVQFDLPEQDLKRLPKNGAFITISNHPLGGIDGIILLKIMAEQRPEFKIIANFFLQRIEPIAESVFPVNPFSDKNLKSSVTGVRQALQHLKEGNPLGIFPAGQVSTYQKNNKISDREWQPNAVKIMQKAAVPIIPVYFHARNSPLFYKLAKISAALRTAKLPSELFSQKKQQIKVRIGYAITVADQQPYRNNITEFSNFIRQKTYLLSKTIAPKQKRLKKVLAKIKPKNSPEHIVAASNIDSIILEIDNLRQRNYCVSTSKNYEVFVSPAAKIPHILREIGRLREITFREVGEGTNRSVDLDEYDEYYYHLFLWDNNTNVIVGSYRVGLGSKIFAQYGVKGFYLSKLFRFDEDVHQIMAESIELGRAFIIKDYQQKPMPLFLLWRGIIHIAFRYPEHKQFTGCVSISNNFSAFSRSLMVEFMKSNYYDPFVAQYVRPRKKFKVKLQDSDRDFIFDTTKADLAKLDKLIDEIEPGLLRLPVLLKKYIKQNAKIAAFNLDPLFNYTVDGLIFIKMADLPEKTIKPALDEYERQVAENVNCFIEKE